LIALQQGAFSAHISPLGAELQSLRRHDEEFLWQGDPAVWGQRAPWLFPFVGRVRGGHYRHAGWRYAMPLHGFAALQSFEGVEQQPDAALLVLRDTPLTHALYPFAFELRIGFRLLHDHELQMRAELHNRSDEPLPFGFGGHPGFALPGAVGDWSLHFEQAERPEVWRIENGLLARRPEPYRWSAPDRLDLAPDPFSRDALVLKSPRSRWVALRHRSGAERLRLHAPEMAQLGLWSRCGGAYVCIEPWWGHDDDPDAPEALLDKPQLLRLAPGQSWARELRISLSRE
jgi:galactose mutarotase-like enzyme